MLYIALLLLSACTKKSNLYNSGKRIYLTQYQDHTQHKQTIPIKFTKKKKIIKGRAVEYHDGKLVSYIARKNSIIIFLYDKRCNIQYQKEISIPFSNAKHYISHDKLFIHNNDSTLILIHNNKIQCHHIDDIRGDIIADDYRIYFQNRGTIYAYDLNMKKIIWKKKMIHMNIKQDNKFLYLKNNKIHYVLNEEVILNADTGSIENIININNNRAVNIENVSGRLSDHSYIRADNILSLNDKKYYVDIVKKPLVEDKNIYLISYDGSFQIFNNTYKSFQCYKKLNKYNICTRPIKHNHRVYFSIENNIYIYDGINTYCAQINYPIYNISFIDNDILIAGQNKTRLYEDPFYRITK